MNSRFFKLKFNLFSEKCVKVLFFPVFGFHGTSFFLFLGAQRTPPCARLDSDGPSFILLRVGLSN
jgi:hypothetical protein